MLRSLPSSFGASIFSVTARRRPCRLVIDTIKIDQSFVNAVAAAREGTSIIRAMITLAISLDLDTVAEGIETAQQLDTLRTLGCTNGQGFLWSRALHPDDALQWMIGRRFTG